VCARQLSGAQELCAGRAERRAVGSIVSRLALRARPRGVLGAMYFVVMREQGPGWDGSRAMREQDLWSEHVDYINAVAEEGFLLMAGPYGEGDSYRAMLVVAAASREQAAARLEEDPWTTGGVLETRSVDRWEVLVGEFASADVTKEQGG
jgi:uncharacterized protein YciI